LPCDSSDLGGVPSLRNRVIGGFVLLRDGKRAWRLQRRH